MRSTLPFMTDLRIGITIGLHHEAEPLWNNGIKQNALFLAEALRHCPSVACVTLVNTTAVAITSQLPWDLSRWLVVPFDAAKDQLDVLIELGGQIAPDQTDYLKSRACHLVSYCCGSEYVMTMESILFARPLFGYHLFVNQRYDALWVIPQLANNSLHFFQTLRRCQAVVAPFVWSPVFIEQGTHHLPQQGQYQSHSRPKRLSIMEPNHDVLKCCIYPTFIIDEAFRKRPDLIDIMRVCNAETLATTCPEFIALMNQLDIVKSGKAIFLGRYDTPTFLAEYTDVMVSHQWDVPLNYFYLEVCWQGYPLIHNAHLCKDLGYYYPDNDVPKGASQLLYALTHHDQAQQAYLEQQRTRLQRFFPDNQEVVAFYEGLLVNLKRQPLV